jgi:hypothetical protein
MEINGLEGMSAMDLSHELSRGGRFIVFTYCISILVMTFKRPSKIYFLKAGESGLIRGLPYLMLSLLLGWWGFPWGPIYTLEAIIHTLSGGKDITREMVSVMGISPS